MPNETGLQVECQRIEVPGSGLYSAVLLFMQRSPLLVLQEQAMGGTKQLLAGTLNALKERTFIDKLQSMYLLHGEGDASSEGLTRIANQIYTNIFQQKKKEKDIEGGRQNNNITPIEKARQNSKITPLEEECIHSSLLTLILPCLSVLLCVEFVVWTLKHGELVVSQKYKPAEFTVDRCDLIDFSYNNGMPRYDLLHRNSGKAKVGITLLVENTILIIASDITLTHCSSLSLFFFVPKKKM